MALSSNAKFLKQFTLHHFRMDEDVIGKPVLDSQR